MTALRAVLLALAGLGAASAAGAWDAGLEPSAQRLVVACAFALAAPLLWPGVGAGPVRTGLRIGLWSGATSALAVLVLAAAGRQRLAQLVPGAAMLLVIVATTLGGAALVELLVRRGARAGEPAGGAGSAVATDGRCATLARELAGRTAALVLALAGTLPLWLGPAAERTWRDRPWTIDAVVAVSPLAHLAIASGNDLFRDPWLYDHANLATLSLSYPRLGRVCIAYACALALLAAAVGAAHRRGGARSSVPLPSTPKENR